MVIPLAVFLSWILMVAIGVLEAGGVLFNGATAVPVTCCIKGVTVFVTCSAIVDCLLVAG